MESVENYRSFLDNQSGHVIRDSKTGEWIVESEGVDPALVSVCVCVESGGGGPCLGEGVCVCLRF